MRADARRIQQGYLEMSSRAAEVRFLELLSVLIDQYEAEYDAVAAPTPLEALKELMAASDMSQKSLGDLLRSSGLASMILSGKRSLSKAQIPTLCEVFRVPADLFV
jgi:HTH-type transcriptional regulator/antitoxin HigA